MQETCSNAMPQLDILSLSLSLSLSLYAHGQINMREAMNKKVIKVISRNVKTCENTIIASQLWTVYLWTVRGVPYRRHFEG